MYFDVPLEGEKGVVSTAAPWDKHFMTGPSDCLHNFIAIPHSGAVEIEPIDEGELVETLLGDCFGN
jgi:hypothetical protein